MASVVGIDVGGTKIAAARVEGTVAAGRVERPTDPRDAAAVLDGIEAVYRDVVGDGPPPAAVGVGMPSQIEFETGTVIASVNIPLKGVPLRGELGNRFGVPVFVDNDGNCAALAEAHAVPGHPILQLVMLTLGTGVGGGLVIDGAIERGYDGLGAELGHVIVDGELALEAPADSGIPRPGSLEWHCSGRGLERAATAAARAGDGALAAALARDGRVTGRAAVAAAEAGDAAALRLFDRFGDWLGLGIASFVNAFQPQRVAIGGGLSRAAALFFERAVAVAARNSLPASWERTTVALARSGPDAGLIGAGLLAVQADAASGDTGGETEQATSKGTR